MSLQTVKRLAADIFGVGVNKIKITDVKEAEGALTREDVRQLIEKGAVTKRPRQGRRSKEKKKKRGPGSKKGKKSQGKEEWMKKVRSQRRLLRELVSQGVLPKEDKRAIYMKIKGGLFRSKRALVQYLKDNEYISQDYELKKGEKQ